MENPPFDDFPQLETSIYRIFPIFFPYFSQMFPIFFPYFRMNFPLKDPIYLGDFQENFPSAEPSGLARNTLLRTRTTRPWMAQDTPSAELQSFESRLVIRPCYTWWDHKASTVPVRVQVGMRKGQNTAETWGHLLRRTLNFFHFWSFFLKLGDTRTHTFIIMFSIDKAILGTSKLTMDFHSYILVYWRRRLEKLTLATRWQ